jgi:ribosomal protein S27E
MDNKYGLGSAKVANVHHEAHHKDAPALHPVKCKHCDHHDLSFSPTMQDHMCNGCGEWQNDVPQGYSTGRSSDY